MNYSNTIQTHFSFPDPSIKTRPSKHEQLHHPKSNFDLRIAQNIFPVCLIRSRTRRLAPPRIACVANKASTFYFSLLNHGAGFLKPITHQVAEIRHAITV